MTFIPYQVDYSVKNTAKTLGFSKKRVSFKFGFANPRAAEQGQQGAQCRGSEHEVTFLWSLASGKRQLFLDGKDVHFSESGMNGWTSDRAWQHSFPLRELSTGRTFKVHFISQPVNKDIPDMKPFDLRINGVSYFNFNEIWKLGTPAMVVRQGPRAYGDAGRGDESMTAEERRLIALAKAESLKEFAKQQSQGKNLGAGTAQEPKKMIQEEVSLISFDDPPPPQQFASTGSVGSGTPQSHFASSLTLDSAIDPSRAYSGNSYGGPPPPPNPYGAPPPPMPGYSPYDAAPPAPGGNSQALTPYTAGPAPSPYGQPAPVQTAYGYGNNNASQNFGSLQSPSGQSYASYGSAPSFARPPQADTPPNPYGGPPPAAGGYGGYPSQPMASGGGYSQPPHQQQQYPPQQQQYSQQPQQQPPYGYPNQPAY
mmetsp:Transcript_15530/g.29650  ORF Transcript_15530/g.29650 Transcript_15530/m.29650 type:complete len:424 (+) Transcript_15530:228-1499(+)